jgi:SAM-dependent methyltransferase
MDSTLRFSNRVEDYKKFRPTYPEEILSVLRTQFGLQAKHVIADIGSGTGISSELFLRNGNHVYAVEPNDAMRMQAESDLARYENFHSIKGTSTQTNLVQASVDFVTAAQAFHWFDPTPTREEFKRILKPGGCVVVIFNDRKTNGSEFSVLYEQLLNDFGSDYKEVKHKNITEKRHKEFLGHYQEFHFPNSQRFDFPGLLGRLKSSSYAPKEGHPQYPAMQKRLEEIFSRTHQSGIVEMEYVTQIFCSKSF